MTKPSEWRRQTLTTLADGEWATAYARDFERKIDADDYAAFWRRLGSCHIKRSTKGQLT